MSMVLYFSKINLNSDKIYDAYDNKQVLEEALSLLLIDIQHDLKYEKTWIHKDGNEEEVVQSIEYRVGIRDKTQDSIHGVVYKESKIPYKKLGADGKIVNKSIQSIEGIRFYFDVYREMVGFHTTNRFGYREFNDVFEGLINKAMEENNRGLHFTVSLKKDNLEIVHIHEELKKIGKIAKLNIRFQPPNPDGDLLDSIESKEEMLEEWKEANVTNTIIEFTSKGENGLDIGSTLIRKRLDEVDLFNENCGGAALQNDYTSISVTGINGRKYTTVEDKPLRKKIERMDDFIEACMTVIANKVRS